MPTAYSVKLINYAQESDFAHITKNIMFLVGLHLNM